MNADEPVARLLGVSHRYGDGVALDDVSLAVPSGCLAGLIGPDGVGKSTLLGLVAGTRRLQSGRVEVLGGSIASPRHRRRVRSDIAYMAQGLGTNLYPDLSVAENVDFFARLFGLAGPERNRRVADLLEATGLAPFRDRHVRKLSGGMKQKLGLCCALVHDPALLVLDEPTTGVDPLSRRQFWQLVDGIRARRPETSVLVATAYMEEAERFDWLAVLDAGKVLATGRHEALEAETGAASLEQAYIALLPESKRGAGTLEIPPRRRRADGAAVAVEARDLSKRFGDFIAVDRVSFEIERGEIFGFVGSNGCGKTTTMKMLTGLLPASEGEARLFGAPVDARDLETRRRVGTMSQSFSLYRELSVRQNLELHARLYRLPALRGRARIDMLIARLGLADAEHTLAQNLSVGIRKRLSLAAALIHEPELLILDEPTSGVDPLARDRFWEQLVQLSREEGVTIFLSTHFMNEAERCDRIALMHAGQVLAKGPPDELVARRGAADLEEVFVQVLGEAGAGTEVPDGDWGVGAERRRRSGDARFDLRRALAVANREAREILRDRIRLAFALLGPVVLLVVDGYGISFDVEDLAFAVLDRDRSPDSRRYLEGFRGSRYFIEEAPIESDAELDRRLASGELALAIDLPTGFGRAVEAGEAPEVGVWLDGAMPVKAETTLGYVRGIHARAVDDLVRHQGGEPRAPPARVEPRYRYNQAFESLRAIVPGVLMLVLVLVPAIMAALGVVREKELGSIANFYVTPITRLEFLLGKQLPYVAVGFAGFLAMLLLSTAFFGVPVTGSIAALSLGALLYVAATTGFGLLVSSFVRTQLAAIFATAILTMLPATQFSGLLSPASSLTGGAWFYGRIFPCFWFQQVSLGTFAKGLGADDLLVPYAVLVLFAAVYLGVSCALLRKQER